MFGLDTLIDRLFDAAMESVGRNERIIKLLKQLNLDPDHPPKDFGSVYYYALVEYGVGKPRPVLEIFRQGEIQQLFREALEHNTPSRLLKHGEAFLAGQALQAELQANQIDVRREFYEFAAVFIKIAKRTRTPAEILTNQKLGSLHRQIGNLQEHLNRLPTLEGMRTEMARLAAQSDFALPGSESFSTERCKAFALAQQMRGWFETLGFRFESHEVWQEDHFEWIINIPVRRGCYERILVRGIDGEAGLRAVKSLKESAETHRTDEGWLVTSRRISRVARDEFKKEENASLNCFTLDELLDQDADFNGYLNWLESEIHKRGIDQKYVPLACLKEEVDPDTQQRIGVSRYGDRDGWINGYIDRWLDDPAKEHISVLGEFGTGKTWFTLHYAWKALQRYREAQQRGLDRPRLPLVIPLRDYAKAVSVESLFSDFFFRKHEIPLPGYSAFEQLNRMGKLLLIFDGFDEMAARVDRQQMINNFWELARVVVPGAKVILTCRTEHFPEAKEGRALLNAELQASTKNLTGETPQFEVLELEKFNNEQIWQVLSHQAQSATVEQIMDNPELLDLARRPVLTELILEALPDIEAGKPVDMSRVYLYAVRHKMERDIKAERTFTSMADKLYFMCELSWEMLSTDRMSINYREFPHRIRTLFGPAVEEQKDLDHWHYDMMSQTILIRNVEGDYTPAHRSLLEFFVAYKLLAELGILAPDFVELAQKQHCSASELAQDYTWQRYFTRHCNHHSPIERVSPLQKFAHSPLERLYALLATSPLAKAVLDLAAPMLDRVVMTERLLDLIKTTRGKSRAEAGYFGGNLAQLLLRGYYRGLEGADLSCTVMTDVDFSTASLRRTDFANAILTNSIFAKPLAGVASVAFSPDGQLLAIGDGYGSIQIWEIASRRIILFVKGHQHRIWSVAFSPDGRSLATGSEDSTAKLWSVVDGRCLNTLEGHQNWVWSVAFSPDGKFLATASADHTVKLWSVADGRCLNTLEDHQNWVWSVAFSPDGRSLATASADQTAKLWSVADGRCFRTLEGHQNRIWSVAFSPDGKSLATGSEDSTAKLWSVADGRCFNTLEGHQNWVWSVAFSPDGKSLATGSEDQTAKLWSVADGRCFNTLEGHQNWVWSVAFSPNSKSLATGSADSTVKLWSVAEGQCLDTLEGYQNWVWSVAFSPDGKSLATGTADSTVKLWSVADGRCLNTLEGHQNRIWSVAFSPDGKCLATASEDQTVKLWSVSDGCCLNTFKGHQNRVWSVAFSPDGKSLATASADQTAKLWSVTDGYCLNTLKGHQNRILSVAFSPDGKCLATGGADQTAKLWSVADGRCLNTLKGHQSRIWSLAFSSDGETLATASEDRTAKLWSVADGRCFNTLEGHQNRIWSLAFSPDGKSLATASEDRTVKLWSVADGCCFNTLEGHQNWVWSLAFSPDGKFLAMGDADQTICLWNLESDSLALVITDQLYTDLDITGVVGLNEGQKNALKLLGARESGQSA